MTQNEKISRILQKQFSVCYIGNNVNYSKDLSPLDIDLYWSGIFGYKLETEVPLFIIEGGATESLRADVSREINSDIPHNDKLDLSFYSTVAVPIIGSYQVIIAASFKTAFIKHDLYRNKAVLYKINVKEEIAYIGEGIILDKDLKPLYVQTVINKYLNQDTLCHTPNIYISPVVFSKSNNLYKFIADTLFPMCVELIQSPLYKDISAVLIKDYKGFYKISFDNTIESIEDKAYEILEQEKKLILQSLLGDAYLFQEMDTVPGD